MYTVPSSVALATSEAGVGKLARRLSAATSPYLVICGKELTTPPPNRYAAPLLKLAEASCSAVGSSRSCVQRAFGAHDACERCFAWSMPPMRRKVLGLTDHGGGVLLGDWEHAGLHDDHPHARDCT